MRTAIATYDVIRYDSAKDTLIGKQRLICVKRGFELRLNGKPFQKIFSSPNDLEDLTFGILLQADKISSSADVIKLTINDNLIAVETKANVQPAHKNFSDVKFIAKDILACENKLLGELSTTHDKANDVHSGVTLLHGEGGYTRQSKEISYCVVTCLEVNKLKKIVLEKDEHTFVTIYPVNDIVGGRFKKSRH